MAKLALGAFLAVTMVVGASAAQATTFPIADDTKNFYITSGSPFSDSVTANFGNGFNTATSFDDSFTFTIPTQSGVGSGSITTSFSNAKNKLTITALYINDMLYSVPTTSNGQHLEVGDIDIMAGVLNTIRVVGFTAAKGGTYSGTATFFANGAVPETATWAMMLGGFGMIGGALRSRRKTAVSFG